MTNYKCDALICPAPAGSQVRADPGSALRHRHACCVLGGRLGFGKVGQAAGGAIYFYNEKQNKKVLIRMIGVICCYQ